MPRITEFSIHISELTTQLHAQCHDSIYIHIDFDKYKTYDTSPISATTTASFSDACSFTYATRYASELHAKMCTFSIYSKSVSSWGASSEETLGSCDLTLHTIASGPSSVCLPILDGSAIIGTLRGKISMTEINTASLYLTRFTTSLSTFGSAAPPDLSACHVLLHLTDGSSSKVTSAATGMTHEYLPIVNIRAYTQSLLQTYLAISFITGGGLLRSSHTLATALLAMEDTPVYQDGKPMMVHLPLYAGKLDSPPGPGAADQVGTIAAELYFKDTPRFAQMTHGYYNGARVIGARVAQPQPPERPKCPVQLLSSSSSTSRSSGLTQPTSTRTVGYVAIQEAVSAANSPSRRASLRRASVSAAADMASAATSGALIQMPSYWTRKVDPSTGRAYFYNSISRASIWRLPSAPTVQLSFTAPGSLGLKLEAVQAVSSRFSAIVQAPGRDWAGTDMLVTEVIPGTQAARIAAHERLVPGMRVRQVNGQDVRGKTFQQALELIVSAGRPVDLLLEDPYAVPPGVAKLAENLGTSIVIGQAVKLVRGPSGHPALEKSSPGLASQRQGLHVSSGSDAELSAPPESKHEEHGLGSDTKHDQPMDDLDTTHAWVEVKDRLSEQVYWVNNATGTIQFSRPAGM